MKCRSEIIDTQLARSFFVRAGEATVGGGANTSISDSRSIHSNRLMTAHRLEDDLPESESIAYCGLSAFASQEAEVAIGRKVLDRVCSQGFMGLGQPKKSMYLRKIDPFKLAKTKRSLPPIITLHGYCNFKINATHENAKFHGLLAAFATGWIFKSLITEHGLVDIWLCDENLKQELIGLQTLAPYVKRFRVV